MAEYLTTEERRARALSILSKAGMSSVKKPIKNNHTETVEPKKKPKPQHKDYGAFS